MAGPEGSDGRRERSRRTRARLVEVATALFIERGYTTTTIEAVAERAGVAPQTVYYVFGTKPTLLAAVLDASIAGDAEPVPVRGRPWFDELASDPDAVSAVTRLVAASIPILSRTAPVYDVVRRAAADPEVGRLLTGNRAGRRDDQRGLIGILARSGHLADGLDEATAADRCYALLNEEVFLLLTADCGWTPDRFQRWATALLVQQLAGITVADEDLA